MNGKFNFPKTFRYIAHRMWLLNRSLLRAIQGFVLGFIAPGGWLAIRLLSGHGFKEELSQNFGVYLYVLTGACLVFALFGWYTGSQEERLRSQALHDDLTGLYNTRHFWARLAQELAVVKRHGAWIALVLIDIDHFKQVNDEYGHVVGNKVLQALSKGLKTEGRSGDTIYRIGGDEFCVILPDCEWVGAYTAATRFLDSIRNTAVKSKKYGAIRVTSSLGIAVIGGGEQLSAKEFFREADQAMYGAKAKGRNRIEPVDIEIRARRQARRELAN